MDGWINKLQQIIDRLKSGGQSTGASTQSPVTPTVQNHNDNNGHNTNPGTSSPTATPVHQDNYPKPADLPVNGKFKITVFKLELVVR
jgi:hypothetical protein